MKRNGIICLLTAILLVGSCATASAKKFVVKKYPYRGYQGEVSLGYAVGVGDYSANRYEVETVHGLRLNPYLFVGAGVGLHYYTSRVTDGRTTKTYDFRTIPVFVNMKGYILTGHVKPFVSIDGGYGMTVREELNFNGFYASPSAGVLFDVPHFGGISVSVGYQSQRLSGQWDYPSVEKTSINAGAVAFKVGIVF